MEAADVLVRDSAGQLQLQDQPVVTRQIPVGVGTDGLQRDALVQFEIHRLVDIAHPAPSKAANHAVSISDDVTVVEGLS